MANQGRKKRILCVGEFTQFHTGFSGYLKELLTRLHATGKYDIAELAVYLQEGNPAALEVPWDVYPNAPHPNAPQDVLQKFESSPFNVFGNWRFTEVLLDYKPDIVINISDPWMQHFINGNPLRKNFTYVHMPTVDSEPQKVEWIQDYIKCDKIITYSYFGKRTLLQQSNNKINVSAVASPGADVNLFRPRSPSEKIELRKKYCPGHENKNIVQTVMRNQPRKLYTQLFKAFNLYLKTCMLAGRKDIADNTVLHIHTNPNDVGWDINQEIVNHHLSSKVLITYTCDICSLTRMENSGFDGKVCPRCKNSSFRATNSMKGVSREVLGELMSIADLYVQYSNAGGWEMPISDAKACGVAVACTDYSAMSEQAHAAGGIPIRVESFQQEPLHQTYALRAVPDNNHLAKILADAFLHKSIDLAKIGAAGRSLIEKEYNWDHVAEVWQSVLDSCEIKSIQETWYGAPQFMPTSYQLPEQINYYQLIQSVCVDVLRQPEKVNSAWAVERINRLESGFETVTDPRGLRMSRPYTIKEFLAEIKLEAETYNRVENLRINQVFGFNTKAAVVKGVI